MTYRVNWLRLGVGVAAAVTVGAGVVLATIPDASGVIHACYTKSTAALRVIDDGVMTCKSGETELTWNVQGVPGPQGPVGPQGAAGDTNVLTDFLSVNVAGTADSRSLLVPGFGTVELSCATTGRADVAITGSLPNDGTVFTNPERFLVPTGSTVHLGTTVTMPGGTAWIENATGHWKIDYVAVNFIPGSGGSPSFPCNAGVVVTVL